jgi:hypothetical protein
MFTCDTGGALNRIVHFYAYTDLGERDKARRALLFLRFCFYTFSCWLLVAQMRRLWHSCRRRF